MIDEDLVIKISPVGNDEPNNDENNRNSDMMSQSPVGNDEPNNDENYRNSEDLSTEVKLEPITASAPEIISENEIKHTTPIPVSESYADFHEVPNVAHNSPAVETIRIEETFVENVVSADKTDYGQEGTELTEEVAITIQQKNFPDQIHSREKVVLSETSDSTVFNEKQFPTEDCTETAAYDTDGSSPIPKQSTKTVTQDETCKQRASQRTYLADPIFDELMYVLPTI